MDVEKSFHASSVGDMDGHSIIFSAFMPGCKSTRPIGEDSQRDSFHGVKVRKAPISAHILSFKRVILPQNGIKWALSV